MKVQVFRALLIFSIFYIGHSVIAIGEMQNYQNNKKSEINLLNSPNSTLQAGDEVVACDLSILTGYEILKLTVSQLKIIRNRSNDECFLIIYPRLSDKQVNYFILSMSPGDITKLSRYFLERIDPKTLSQISGQQFKSLNDEQLSWLTRAQINNLTEDQMYFAYKKLVNSEGFNDFIFLLGAEQILKLIRLLPLQDYAAIFNSADEKSIVVLFRSLDRPSKQLLISNMDVNKVTRIESILENED